MTREKFLSLRKDLLDKALAVTSAKGNDYTKGAEDILTNFKETGKDLAVEPKKVWGIFAKKHWDAITSYIKSGGQSESEPIEQRIIDLINYLVLFHALNTETNVDNVSITDTPKFEEPNFTSEQYAVLYAAWICVCKIEDKEIRRRAQLNFDEEHIIEREYEVEDFVDEVDAFLKTFDWRSSPEGFSYWEDIYDNA